MKFECGDLDRALAVSELMPEAREHLRHCANCRKEYRVWTELSSTAKELREEWESPDLWPAIRRGFEAEEKLKPKPVTWSRWGMWGALAAAILLAAGLGWWELREKSAAVGAEERQGAKATPAVTRDRDFLTEQALGEVEKTEAAYRRSIDKLSALAEPELRHPVTAMAVNCREKLLMLDSAILDTRSNLDHNRFNVRLQMDLADLYREKQQTLKELLTSEQKKN